MKITGETIFYIPSNEFAISPSNEEYTLAYSADGVNFTNYEKATPAGETLVVNGIPKFMKFKLIGNNSTVTIQY